MKTPHITKHTRRAGLLLLMLFCTACTKQPAAPVGEPETVLLRFTADIPAHDLPVSRGMSGGDNPVESRPEYIDLLIFDSSTSPETYVKRYACGNIETSAVNPSNGYRSISFQARVEPQYVSSDRRLVVVVNAPEQIRELEAYLEAPATPAAERQKPQVMSRLRFTLDQNHGWKWPAQAESPGRPGLEYFPIPMYGETGVIFLINEGRYELALSRMLARIDVNNYAPGFEITAIYLLNYATSGFIAPAWNLTSGLVLPVAPTVPYLPGRNGLPGDVGIRTGYDNALIYEPGGNREFAGEIYTFTVPAGTSTTDPNAPCLLIAGEYEGVSGYYRLDFLHYPDESASNPSPELLPLLRNHRYVFNITAAGAAGYATVQEALASSGSVKLQASLFTFDEREITNLVFNAEAYLGVGKDVVFPAEADTYDAGAVVTNVLSGWSLDTGRGTDGVEYVVPETGALQTDWIVSASNDGGVGAPRGNLSVQLTANVAAQRSAYIYLKAGALRHKIKVTQRSPD